MLKKLLILSFLIHSFSYCLLSQTSGLPLLDMNKIRFDFGKTTFMESKSDKLILKNIGDTLLTIYRIDSLKPPFYGTFQYPDTLQKNDSVKFGMFYKPFRAAKDSQRVYLYVDTRLSHSIGMLFDVSTSMNDNMPNEAVRKITAAVNAGKSFIDQMLATPKVWDEAGVFSFSGGFTVNQDFTTDKVKLKNALPNQTSSRTAFYDACINVINRLSARKFLKVLIALTDGEDNSSKNATSQTVINQAKAANIKVYTIGIGSSTMDNTLRNIATSTGGEFFKATTSKELNDIYYRIFKMLSKNIQLYFDILGYCSSPSVYPDCTADTIVRPGDTVSYKIFLKGVSSSGAMNQNYNLMLSFNSGTVTPLLNNDLKLSYLYDNKLIAGGKVKENIDSFPLAELKFLALIGDSACTDIKIDLLSWDNNLYESVKSTTFCSLCVEACARNLRTIVTNSHSYLSQNVPNPFKDNTNFQLKVTESGIYGLCIFDLFGRKIKTIFNKSMNPGTYNIAFEASDLSSGTYIYTLTSGSGTFSKMMIVSE